jgi:flagellar biosynthetic protein FlhB
MALFDSRTEAATPKRREDARRKGQVARSREVVAVIVLAVGFATVRAVGPIEWSAWREDLEYFLTTALGAERDVALQTAVLRALRTMGIGLLPLFGALMVAAVVGCVMQTGPMLIGEPLKWDATKIDPIKGLQRMFSSAALGELVKSTLKVGLSGWVAYRWLQASYPQMLLLAQMDLPTAATFAGKLLSALFWKLTGVLVLIAVADYVWQRYQYEVQLRMTREEVREEIRQQEGSPEIKGAQRRRQREIARGRMMQAVRSADVVVTNPTHYAVALVYDPTRLDAPQVVARGQRLVAQRIKEIAREAEVPIVENPPLARSLFAACDVGDLVPAELYAAVAEVLAYVYRLSGRRLTA